MKRGNVFAEAAPIGSKPWLESVRDEMDCRQRLIALLFCLCAALGAAWWLALEPEEDRPVPSSLADAQPPLAFEPARTKSEPTDSPGRIRFLEFDSDGGPGERASDSGSAETSKAAADQPGALLPLPVGSGRILFTVEGGSGSPAEGAAVTVRSLEPAGGAERILAGRDGGAHFIGLAAGRYAYRVQDPNEPEVASADSVWLEEGEWRDITVRLVGVNLAIAGRVLNPWGEPLAGIEVSANRHHFASGVSESVSGNRSPRSARSRGDGSFEIRGLAEGEYDVETQATERFAPAKALVRAGGASVDLVLREGLRVYGTVTSARGEALARVHVGAQGPTTASAYTNERGEYELHLEREPEDGAGPYTIRFNLPGYEEAQRPLPGSGAEGARALRVDIELRAAENAAPVTGIVESEHGEPVSGATVILSMQQGPNHQAVSGADGSFSVPDVKIGRGYYLRVIAPVPFRDYAEREISIAEDGASLDIVLESLDIGRLTGRMVDVEGNPLPGFRLWLVGASVRSALPVSADERGYFELERAPAGSLSFDTRVSPRLRVSGLTLREGGEADVLLVLDSGDREISGRVLDGRGDPVGGAQVTLSWLQTSGGLQSTSQRATGTDPNGGFRFGQLGPGEHLLEVHAAGYRSVQEYRDASRYAEQLEVRLEPNGS